MATETLEAAGEAAAHAAGAAAGNAEAAGMPQLDFSTFANQIFWLIVTLVAIFFVLSKVALPRIGAILADRRGRITRDIAAAEDFKAKAVEAEKAYDKALADARAEAARIIAAAKADIQKDLDLATVKADAELAAQAAEAEARILQVRATVMASVSEVANDTAGAIVAALGGSADAATITAAVSARLKG